jgi:hypothetical protein
MSEDEHQLADTMVGLVEALLTAHMRYINKQRSVDNASVLTAVSMFVAVIVDSLTHREGDPSDEEAMDIITDVVTRMLEDKPHLRRLAVKIIDAVLAEGARQ